VANKDFVFNNDSLANKAVGGDFAAGADRSIFLDFHEGPHAAVIPNGAAVKVHLIWMIDRDVGSQFTRVGYWHTILLSIGSDSAWPGAHQGRASDSIYLNGRKPGAR
jgi:hypothetical protein